MLTSVNYTTYNVNYTFWCLIAKMAPTVFISRYAAVESGMCGSSSGGDSDWTEKRTKKRKSSGKSKSHIVLNIHMQ
jgi:hypothetical protein